MSSFDPSVLVAGTFITGVVVNAGTANLTLAGAQGTINGAASIVIQPNTAVIVVAVPGGWWAIGGASGPANPAVW